MTCSASARVGSCATCRDRYSRALASLAHPNIARIFPPVQQGDTYYLLSEYVEGTALQVLVQRDGPLALATAVDYLHQAALGLGHAHEAGVAHRDLSPLHLLVSPAGTVKVVHLGLTRFFQDEDILTKNYDESVIGTVDYLAPE